MVPIDADAPAVPKPAYLRRYEGPPGRTLEAHARDGRKIAVTFPPGGVYETSDKAVIWVLEQTFGLRAVKED